MSRTKNNSIRSVRTTAIVIVVLLIAAHYIGVLRPAEQLVLRITAPIQTRIYSFFTNTGQHISEDDTLLSRDDLLKKNGTLESELATARAELAALEQQLKDAVLLEEQRIFLEEYRLRGVSVSIVNRSTDYFSQILQLTQVEETPFKREMRLSLVMAS